MDVHKGRWKRQSEGTVSVPEHTLKEEIDKGRIDLTSNNVFTP